MREVKHILITCFNSLQVGSQHFFVKQASEEFVGFNSLQVGSQQLQKVFNLNSRYGFNSLQVGSQLEFIRETFLWFEKRFQFLIGRLATSIGSLFFVFFFRVSIPYRQARNQEEIEFIREIFIVSIPYRQARNDIQAAFYSIYSIRFNSLQVGSQQANKHTISCKLKSFQFLIGRLATFQGQTSKPGSIGFQFLIGRLATFILRRIPVYRPFCFNSLQVGSQLCHLSNCYFGIRVSIPYRQARNEARIIAFEAAKESFNSLQVGSQLVNRVTSGVSEKRFNSLQVGSQLRICPIILI